MQEDWIIVEAPDGTEIEFPSTMSDDDIAGVMRQQYPPNDSAQKFLNVGNQMGMAMPSMDQFAQIRDASVAREQDMARTLDTMGRNVVERRRRHSRDPFRRSTERVDISLDGKDPAPAKNYSELGANELGTSQGLTFRLGDEIKGLIHGEQAGKDQRRLVNYAKRAEPNAFNEGELVGTGFNTLGTLPLAAPRSLQVARALPGGAKTKAFLTGLMSGAGWDTAFQMAGGDGSIADRFADTDKTQTATAAAIGGGAGWLISSIANPLSREASEFADVLDGVLDTRGAVTPDGLRSLERFLRNKGIALDDVTLGRIQTVIQDHAQTGAKSLSLPVRVKDVLVEALDGGSGQIRDAIKNQLRGTMGMGDEGATTIQNAIDEDYAASRQAIQDQYGKRLGQRSRIASEDKTLAELRRIGEEGYEPLLERGATSYQGARDLDEVLKGPGINKLKSPLEEIAAGEGLSLEDMIQQNPLRAAHWMQSKARQLAESATDAVKSQAFSAFRRRLLNVIEEAAPGYDKIRKKYGDEFGNLQALEFGDKFLTNAGKAFEIDKMARAFKNLSAAQKRVALLSVRDVLRTATGKGKKAAPPRLTRVGEEQTLEALETVFGARGARVAQDIEDVDEFLRLRTGVDVRGRGSQTTPLAEDIKTATRNVQPTWRRKIGGALENLAGDTALTAMGAGPIQSARAVVGRAGQAIGGNMSGKMNAFAELLEAPIKRGQARVAAQRKTPMKGPDGKFISNEKARELGLLDDEPQNAFSPTPAGEKGILGNQRGVMMIDGQPRRRQDVLREARQAGDGSFPRAQPQTPPQPPANAFAERSGGLRESPLLPLLGIGAAGTGGMVAYDQMNRSQAVAPTGPPSNAFVQGIMRNANTALDDINMRREQGLPKTPGLKPDISGNQRASAQAASDQARQAEAQRRQQVWEVLRSRGDGVKWTQAHEKRAGDLKIKPDEARMGIVAKRLAYSPEMPIEQLESAPIEILVNGQWMPESALEDAR